MNTILKTLREPGVVPSLIVAVCYPVALILAFLLLLGVRP